MQSKSKNNNKTGSVEASDYSDLLACPDLTFAWNRAAQLAIKKEISVYEMNDVWGALRILEKHGFCVIAESAYD